MSTTVREWPYGFLDEFWKYRQEELPTDRKQELIASVEYVLNSCHVKTRNLEMLRLRYQSGKTLKEIADQYGISRECVRQLIHGVIRELRRSSIYKCILVAGVASYMRKKTAMEASEQFKYIADFQDRQMLTYAELVNRYKQNDKPVSNSAPLYYGKRITVTRNTEIGDLPLSVRSFNSLYRAGYRTVADILMVENPQTLMDTRNFGIKSFNEVTDVLDRYGFDVSSMRSYLQRVS